MAMKIPTWFAIGRIKRNAEATTRLSTNPVNSDRIKRLRMVKSSQVVPAIVTVSIASVNKKGIFISVSGKIPISQFLFFPVIKQLIIFSVLNHICRLSTLTKTKPINQL